MYGYIYMFINRTNNKKYIGQHIGEEIDENYFGSGLLLNKAFKKYNENNFSFKVLGFFETKELLNYAEEFYIEKYGSLVNKWGYNIAKGGQGGDTLAGMTEEQYNHWYLNNKNAKRNYNPWEYMENVEEVKKKISNSNRGENNPMYGKDWRKGKTLLEVWSHNYNMSKSLKGKKKTEDSKINYSIASKKRWENEEYRKKYYRGNHPHAKKVELYLPEREVLFFDCKKDMVEWCKRNLGITENVLQTTPKYFNPNNHKSKKLIHLNGIYFKYVGGEE